MTVVDASIVVRLLLNRREDGDLRTWFTNQTHVHAPMLIDAEVTSAIRGLLMSSKSVNTISAERAAPMVDDYADLPIDRYPLLPHQQRVLALRDNFTAYEAFYIALAEALGVGLLTDDCTYAKSPGHSVLVTTWP